MAFPNRDEATVHDVTDGETLQSIATSVGATVADLTSFNFGTVELKEVNRALVELVGARKETPDGTTYEFTSKDKDRGSGKLLIPKKFEKTGLAPGKTYVAHLKPLVPICALDIVELDKWFLPGEASDGGELCTIRYALEGRPTTADKVAFEVHASHYSSAELDDDHEVDFDPIDGTLPVYTEALAATKGVARSTHSVDNWRGQCNATDGMLKPRAGKVRCINVAFSPYTAHLCFYKEDADKKARIVLKDFWPRWDTSGNVIADSLKVRYEVEETARLELGQIVIFDKTGAVVFRHGLKKGDLSKGLHVFDWDGKLKDGTAALPASMPYRVQLQAHTGLNEPKGLAIAAMHTEVRLFVDPATGAHPVTPHLDPNSLALSLAPYAPVEPTQGDDEDRWVQLRLAKAGFHPGPIDGELGRDEAKLAIAEFQRSLATFKGGHYERIKPNGSANSATTQLLAAIPDDARPMFGDPTSRADVVGAGTINGKLSNPSDANGLLLWVDDRHYYTESVPKGFPDHFDLGNYRESMDVGDGRVDFDAETIARPWVPLAVDLPVLTKDTAGNGLLSTAKIVNAASRKAIGPLRVDFTFEELPPELSTVDQTHAAYDKRFVRTHKWLEQTFQGQSASHAGRTLTNCPQANGGARPASADAYYKALVGHGDDSLIPWVAYDDTARKAICTVAHDDYGQEDERVYATHLGRAGAFFRPSRVAGDGYRFGARVGFDEIGDAPASFPNRAVLAKRYPLKPQAYTCPLRLWRKTSYRGYLYWCPSADQKWAASHGAAAAHYGPACLHFAQESAPSTGGFVQDRASNLLGFADFRKVIRSNVTGDYRNQPITLNADYVWPFLTAKRWGLPASEPGTRINTFRSRVLDPMLNQSWRKFRSELIWALLAKIERQHGLLKGHLVVQFTDSPRGTIWEYKCGNCNQTFVEMIENLPVAERMDQLPCPACGAGKSGSGVKPAKTGQAQTSLLLPAVGVGMGATWVFTSGNGDVWAHEMGHHRHLEHAQSNPGQTSPAPGAKNAHHDSQTNTHHAFAVATIPRERCWDLLCIMSYNHSAQYFCGKCALKMRGWKVEGLANAAGGLHD
jgi:hypothetical protein